MTRFLTASAVLVMAACSGPHASQRGQQPAPTGEHAAAPAPSQEMVQRMCPMAVPNTTVTAADTPRGEALTFTTASGQVDDLRRRVRAMAMMHNEHHAGGGAAMSGTGQGGAEQAGHPHMMMPPASRATVQDVDKGIRVEVVPNDPAQVNQLRTAARMHAEYMQREGCAMMSGT